jgi:short-subunit dehydrogenase
LKIADRKVLITGAGSGIGRELALRFGSAGGALALVGRRTDALQDTAAQIRARGGTAHVLAADLADGSAPDAVVAMAVEHLGGMDVLINNAGNVRAGELESLSQPDIEAMLDVDLLAPILLTRAALPHLRAAEESLVLGIASGIALVALPYYSVYAAVKAGLAHFDESLRRELLDTGVRVVTVFPGATATPMMDSSDAGEDLGFGRRRVGDVVDDIVAGIEADLLEINTALESRRALQELNRTDIAAVDDALRPRLAALRAAVSGHRSI